MYVCVCVRERERGERVQSVANEGDGDQELKKDPIMQPSKFEASLKQKRKSC
jgi:hypothetical protein